MEIDTKRFTVMIVGLAVAIILVSGMMVPVISSLSSNNENPNEGGEKYFANDLSDVFASAGIIIPEKYNSYQGYESYGEEGLYTSDSILTLEDIRELQAISIEAPADYTVLLADIYNFESDTITGFRMDYSAYDNSVLFSFSGPVGSVWEDVSKWTAFEINFNNGHIHMETVVDSQTYTIESYVEYAKMMSEKEEGYIFIKYTTNDPISVSSLQVHNTTYIQLGIMGAEGFPYTWPDIMGSQISEDTEEYIKINNCTLIDDETAYPDTLTYVADVTVPLDDGKMPSPQPCTFTIISSPEGHELTELVCEISVVSTMAISDDGGSGSNIPPTLMSLISVIPLITVIGIIIGAVGYLRVKD